ncbi:MAG: hypothetical protein H6559_19030 [Lewinellaceae bacterium]|nr:hypothetical protein [Lewinellaceae bacterium]
MKSLKISVPGIFSALLPLFLFLPSATWAGENIQDTPSAITEVTIFRQGAEVRREGKVSIAATAAY